MTTKRIITLLSDFGTADGYVGSVKGVIKTIFPDAEIIDISHDIDPFNISAAAFTLLNYYRHFPHDTVHLAVVDPGVGGSRRPIIIRTAHHYFVGPDNGIFQYIVSREACRAYEINTAVVGRPVNSATFHARDIFAPTAAMLARGASPGELGTKLDRLAELSTSVISKGGSEVIVNSVAIDRFGNIIAGFSKEDLARLKKEKVTGLRLKTFVTDTINNFYSEKKVGEPLALWNSQDFLEIAVCKGDAARFFNFDPANDKIYVQLE